ncbi:MAG: 23S rRNA (adenine(2503)-C(2))-methyltransferase RlmN, partial [Epsilonproteobacteria bacterium]|nr:23S rRNA (adenine(2503)-C(2))-methyltransferase RlmN [Campylobacterota bacterium]
MNNIKPSLMDFTLKELQNIVKPSFRAKQIYGWLYHQYVQDFEDMKNIPKALKEELAQKYLLNPLKIVNKEVSSDGTIKYLLQMQDGKTMEAVWLKMKDTQYDDAGEVIQEAKYTICVSTQVGCKVGCAFCLTAKGGFTRDLSAGEIVAQVVTLKKD